MAPAGFVCTPNDTRYPAQVLINPLADDVYAVQSMNLIDSGGVFPRLFVPVTTHAGASTRNAYSVKRAKTRSKQF